MNLSLVDRKLNDKPAGMNFPRLSQYGSNHDHSMSYPAGTCATATACSWVEV